jgi:hypothetical protein
MASVAALYTPEVLMLATGLVQYRWDDQFMLQGGAFAQLRQHVEGRD